MNRGVLKIRFFEADKNIKPEPCLSPLPLTRETKPRQVLQNEDFKNEVQQIKSIF